MNSDSICAALLPLAIVLTLGPKSEKPATSEVTSRYLPASDELVGWKPAGSPLQFVGEDLYSLIDGGAVIYHEYGFRQVTTQEYVSAGGSSINLQIFEMTDPASAYGVYTFKAGHQGTPVSVGTEALLEAHYLNFWKGRFCVTLSGSDLEKETREGMLILGWAVDEKIGDRTERPSLVSLLPEDSTTKPVVTYLKGKLGLTSGYDFHPENIFGIQEGVEGDYQDFQIFILKYVGEDHALKWFHSAGNDLRNAPEYSDFAEDGGGYLMTHVGDKYIHMKPDGPYILIFVGPREIDSDMQLERVRQRIDKASVGVYPEGGIHEQKGPENP